MVATRHLRPVLQMHSAFFLSCRMREGLLAQSRRELQGSAVAVRIRHVLSFAHD